MKNKLLATVAMTAVIGCTSFAVAQNREGGATQSQGAQQHQMGNPGGAGSPGGAMSTPSGGNESSTSGSQGSGERKSFSQEERNKSSTKSAPQGSAQEQRGPQNQRGAQEQRGKEDEQRGAQNQRGTEQRGAQDNDRAGTQERMGQDRGKAVPGQAQQNGTSGRAGGASVQLSQDQRTKVKDVIVRDRNVARVNSANFSVSVGAKVPRDVHVSVLPPEIVTIVPEYRGFEYVMVGDQLLIIDPNTLEIVAVLPA
jgi:hypothetical protein